jgi:hypothetical protein
MHLAQPYWMHVGSDRFWRCLWWKDKSAVVSTDELDDVLGEWLCSTVMSQTSHFSTVGSQALREIKHELL